MAFEELFGAGGSPEARAARRRANQSILDSVTLEIDRLRQDIGTRDRNRLNDYLESVREIDNPFELVSMDSDEAQLELVGAALISSQRVSLSFGPCLGEGRADAWGFAD